MYFKYVFDVPSSSNVESYFKNIKQILLGNVNKNTFRKCIDLKIRVVATVCDMSTVNVKVLKNLGVTTKRPIFHHIRCHVVP